MLTLVLGRAGTGKTAFVMDDIRQKMDAGESNLLLIVPEQYSHDAERRLNAVCGDKLSLHGETLSFTRLCRRVFSEIGGAPEHVLDTGGQMLTMYRAIESVARRLKVFGSKGLRTELLEKMLSAVKEFKSLRLTAENLEQIAEKASSPLRDKLRDLILIFNAYDTFTQMHGGDATDELSLLADMIGESAIATSGRLYFDGFDDFTAQEFRVIEELLLKNAELTICLSCDLTDDSEIFEVPRKTAGQIQRLAEEYGTKTSIITRKPERNISATQPIPPTGKSPELAFLEKHLFMQKAAKFPGQCSAITVYSAPTRYTECEYAAYKVWEHVRAGYRWRDIGVMARDWEEYGPICENVFEKYAIPFFSSGKADILDKPPVALIDAVLDVATSGWEYKPAFRFLKTGLMGISADDCAELENYILKWNIRGSMWERDWTLPVSGYGGDSNDTVLTGLNSLRRQITGPVIRLRDGIKGVTGADTKLRALYKFLEDIKLPERLMDKARVLKKRGDARLADEYTQVWDVINNAMDQIYKILGETPLSAVEFRKLFMLTLSQYDVGVIPVSLDRTALGGMAKSRRRDLKCLIILGATDENMPKLTKSAGALSDNERAELCKLGADMPSGLEDRLQREMNMIYSTLTLPSSELIVMYPNNSGERPSLIIKRIKATFSINERTLNKKQYMSAAPNPYLELIATQGTQGDGSPVLRGTQGDGSPVLRTTADGTQGDGSLVLHAPETQGDGSPVLRTTADEPSVFDRRLSGKVAESLYGSQLSLSASRVEKYYSCPFQHFLQSGLKLSPRVPAEFDAQTAGIFMHYVLEGVAREIKASVGYKNADEKLCRDLTGRYIEQFVHDYLFDFEGKNARFIHLFRRLGDNALHITVDMMEELKHSDFEPLDFELDFSELQAAGQGDDTPAMQDQSDEQSASQESSSPLNLKGVVDRVDGYKHGEKTYLRVIDYKTGKKSLNLPDVLQGRDMQMLIYLFALQKYGSERYGGDIAPAGVLYIPARDVIIKAPRNVTDEDLKEMRQKALKRSGLVLNDPLILEAMENGDEKKYLPVKLSKDGKITGDSLVTPEQVSLLSNHIDHMLHRAVGEILDGKIECRPYYKNANDNACQYCEYSTVCAFDEEMGDKRRFVPKMKTAEIWKQLTVDS